MENIFAANSAYSLFLYVLKYPEKIDKTLFLLGESVRHANVPYKLGFDVPAEKEIRETLLKRLIEQLNVLAPEIQNAYVNVTSVGDDVADALAKRYHVTAISDGLSDFQKFPEYVAQNRFPNYFRVGEPIKNITVPAGTTLETDSIQRLWFRCSYGQHKQIANIFNLKQDALTCLAKKEVVLITQPLSEDGILSEHDKIAFYKDILSNYPADKVVVKPHSQEKTNWGKALPKTPIVSNRVPTELLMLLVPVKKVATFYLTAGTNLVSPKKVDIYAKGFETLSFVHPELPTMGKTPYVNIEALLKDEPFNLRKVPDKKGKWYPKRHNAVRNRSHDSGRQHS